MADMSMVYTIEGVDALSGPAGAAAAGLGAVESAAGRATGVLTGLAETAGRVVVALGALTFGAVAAGITSAVTSASSFSTEISNIGAVAGATAQQMQQISATALQLGKDTVFSASEAAQGMEELLKAGVAIPDVLNGGAKAMLDLAAAGGVAVPQAATIMSTAMNTFSLSGDQASHVADVLAGAANASAIDISDLGFSLSSVGAVAATMGVSLEDTATAIAVLGQAGLKGADAGTSLKTMLLNLSPQTKAASTEMQALGIITGDTAAVTANLTGVLNSSAAGRAKLAELTKGGLVPSENDLYNAVKKLDPAITAGTTGFTAYGVKIGALGDQFFDATGAIKPMPEVFDVLSKAVAGMSKEQEINALKTLFGTDAIRASAIAARLAEGGFTDMAEAMSHVTAAQVAATRLDNLHGSLEQLRGSVETASISFGLHLLPAIRSVVDFITSKVNASIPVLDALGQKIEDAFAKNGPALAAFAGKITAALGQVLPSVAQKAGAALDATAKVIASLLGLEVLDYGNHWQLWGDIVSRSLTLAQTAVGAVVSAVQAGFPLVLSAIQTVIPVAESLGKAFIDNVATQITFITQTVIPPLVSIFQQVASFATSTLVPAFSATGSVMRGVFGESLTWLANTALPPLLGILGQTAAFFTTTILPSVSPLATALRTVLGDALTWLSDTGWPLLIAAATPVVAFFRTQVIPAIVPVAEAIGTTLAAAITWITTTGWPTFLAAVTPVATFITGTVVPAVQSLVTWLQTNLPPAITGIVTAFQAVQTTLTPIVQAIFSGDIATALAGLGTAFANLAILVTGWISDQIAKVDWQTVWSKATTIASALGAYVAGLAVDFAGWLGVQASKIVWSDVWVKVSGAAEALGSYLLTQAIGFGAWLADQSSKIVWSDVWANATAAGAALGSYLLGQAVDFATWLGKQAEAIPWDTVWTNVKTAAISLSTYLATQAVDFAMWLYTEAGKIPWDTVWTNVKTAAISLGTYLATQAVDFATWLGQQATAIPWPTVWSSVKTAGTEMGNTLKTLAVDMTTWLGEQAGAINWTAVYGNIHGSSEALQAALQKSTQEKPLVWADILGPVDATSAQWAKWLDDVAHGVDWNARGQVWGADFVKALQGMFAGGFKQVTDDTASWDAWADKISVATLTSIGKSFTSSIANLTKIIVDWLSGAFTGAFAQWNPVWPSWVPGVGGQPVKGGPLQTPFPVTPGLPVQQPTNAPNAGGGNVMSSTGGGGTGVVFSSMEEEDAYIAQAAAKRGLLPSDALAVFGRERAGQGVFPVGDEGSSFGPTQMHVGGIAGGGNSGPGMGDDFRRDTGLDPADPSNVQAMIDYSLNQVVQRGSWSQFHAAPPGVGVPQDAHTVPISMPGQGQQATPLNLITGPSQTVAGPIPGGVQNFQQTQQAWDAGMADANAICGPYLASLFTSAAGRPPTRDEAVQLAERMNIYSSANGGTGILNASRFPDYANALIQQINPGSPLQVQQKTGVSNFQAQQTAAGALANGSPLVGFNTAGHYFGADQYNAETGQFHVGGTGLSLAGGSDWMTVDQMTAKMGGLIGVLTEVNTANTNAGTSFKGFTESMGDSSATIVSQATDATGQVTTLWTNAAGDYETVVTGANGAVLSTWTDTAVGVSSANDAMGVSVQANGELINTIWANGTSIIAAGADARTTAIVDSSTGQTIAIQGSQDAQTAAIAAGAAAQGTAIQNLSSQALISTTALGTGMLTSISDMAGNTTTTVTNMQGAVTQQFATLSNGAQLSTNDMNTKVTGSVDQMGGLISTTMSDTAGNMVTTITTAGGQVVSQFSTMSDGTTTVVDTMAGQVVSKTSDMNTSVSGSAQDMSSTVGTALDALTQPLADTATGMDGVSTAAGASVKPTQAEGAAAATAAPQIAALASAASSVQPINMGDSVKNLQAVEHAATSAAKAIASLGNAGGKSVSGSGSNNNTGNNSGGSQGGGKAAGGSVDPNVTYIVGENGPEVFVPATAGIIIPNHKLKFMAAGGVVGTLPDGGGMYGVAPLVSLSDAAMNVLQNIADHTQALLDAVPGLMGNVSDVTKSVGAANTAIVGALKANGQVEATMANLLAGIAHAGSTTTTRPPTTTTPGAAPAPSVVAPVPGSQPTAPLPAGYRYKQFSPGVWGVEMGAPSVAVGIPPPVVPNDIGTGHSTGAFVAEPGHSPPNVVPIGAQHGQVVTPGSASGVNEALPAPNPNLQHGQGTGPGGSSTFLEGTSVPSDAQHGQIVSPAPAVTAPEQPPAVPAPVGIVVSQPAAHQTDAITAPLSAAGTASKALATAVTANTTAMAAAATTQAKNMADHVGKSSDLMRNDVGVDVTQMNKDTTGDIGTMADEATTSADNMRGGVITAADLMKDGAVTAAGLMGDGVVGATSAMHEGAVGANGWITRLKVEGIDLASRMNLDVTGAATALSQNLNDSPTGALYDTYSRGVQHIDKLRNDSIDLIGGTGKDKMVVGITGAAATLDDNLNGSTGHLYLTYSSGVTWLDKLRSEGIGLADKAQTGISGSLGTIKTDADKLPVAYTGIKNAGDTLAEHPLDPKKWTDAIGKIQTAADNATTAIKNIPTSPGGGTKAQTEMFSSLLSSGSLDSPSTQQSGVEIDYERLAAAIVRANAQMSTSHPVNLSLTLTAETQDYVITEAQAGSAT